MSGNNAPFQQSFNYHGQTPPPFLPSDNVAASHSYSAADARFQAQYALPEQFFQQTKSNPKVTDPKQLRKEAFWVQKNETENYKEYFHSISASQSYRHFSFEEIRWLNYKLSHYPASSESSVTIYNNQHSTNENDLSRIKAQSTEETLQEPAGAHPSMPRLNQSPAEQSGAATQSIGGTQPVALQSQIPDQLTEKTKDGECSTEPKSDSTGDAVREDCAGAYQEPREIVQQYVSDVFPTVAEASNVLSAVAMKNGYYCLPMLESLEAMTVDELSHVEEFVVGRSGCGEIRFEVPVDLSNINIHKIMGIIVVLEEQSICVYPDQKYKPAQYQGLNVPATILLECCFLLDPEVKTPITDPQHPEVGLFVEKLRAHPEYAFVDYIAVTGDWVFRMSHF